MAIGRGEPVIQFTFRRLLMALPTIALVSITVFALIRFIPGDPAALMLGDMAQPELVEAIVAQVRGMIQDERDDAALDEVRKNAERHLKQAAKLRAYPLRNADEPDFIFRPYRAEG